MLLENNENFMLDVQKYLKRLNYDGPLDGSVDALFALQEAHYESVPYENFDILRGRAISMDLPDLYKKIVLMHRGGYCFELNGLFGALLRALGYDVTEHFARFLRNEPQIAMPRHRALIVKVQDKRYFVDVGVGGIAPRWPLLMTPDMEQRQNDETYRLSFDPVLSNVIQEFRHGEWANYISFSDNPAYPVDFVAVNYWCQHAKESIFNKEPMATIRTPDGRVTMYGREIKIFSKGSVEVISVEEEELDKIAKEWFGADLTLL